MTDTVLRDSEEMPAISAHGIVYDGRRLSEIDSGHIMVSVDAAAIQHITLHHGLQAPRPALQILVGLALLAVGYYPATHLLHWFRHGGTIMTFEVWLIPVALLGLWVTITALRRGYFLDVETTTGRQRLAFHGRPDPASLRSFLQSLQTDHGLATTDACSA